MPGMWTDSPAPGDDNRPALADHISNWVDPPAEIGCPVCSSEDVKVRVRNDGWEFWCTGCDCQGPAEMITDNQKRRIKPMEA